MKRRKSRKGERRGGGREGGEFRYSRNLCLIKCVVKTTSFEACFENNKGIGLKGGSKEAKIKELRGKEAEFVDETSQAYPVTRCSHYIPKSNNLSHK